MRGGFVEAKVDGVVHRIPESWLVGFCREQGGLPGKTTAEAVRWWHEQWRLEQQHEAQKRAEAVR